MNFSRVVLLSVGGLLAACGPVDARAVAEVKASLVTQGAALQRGAEGLCAAAPTHGWSSTADATALVTMKEHWRGTRVAWERLEGTLSMLDPELDEALDARYSPDTADADLFDGAGFTGTHAVERVLWADVAVTAATSLERSWSNHRPALFPASDGEALAFREGLCARLVADAQRVTALVEPLELDSSIAFRSVLGGVEEQLEKVTDAAAGVEESRYSRTTLADLRANLEGAQVGYAAFRPWVAQQGAQALDERVMKGFARLSDAYAATQGDALPDDLTGLTATVTVETDPRHTGSLSFELRAVREVLGLPIPPES